MDPGPERLVLMAEPLFEEYLRLVAESKGVYVEVDWGDPVLPPGLMDRRLLYEPRVTLHTKPPEERDERPLPASGTTDRPSEGG